MDDAEARRIERVINRELAERFPGGAALRAQVRQHDDDPAIEPGQHHRACAAAREPRVPRRRRPGRDRSRPGAWRTCVRPTRPGYRSASVISTASAIAVNSR